MRRIAAIALLMFLPALAGAQFAGQNVNVTGWPTGYGSAGAMRCVKADGSGFESCAGGGSSSGPSDVRFSSGSYAFPLWVQFVSSQGVIVGIHDVRFSSGSAAYPFYVNMSSGSYSTPFWVQFVSSQGVNATINQLLAVSFSSGSTPGSALFTQSASSVVATVSGSTVVLQGSGGTAIGSVGDALKISAAAGSAVIGKVGQDGVFSIGMTSGSAAFPIYVLFSSGSAAFPFNIVFTSGSAGFPFSVYLNNVSSSPMMVKDGANANQLVGYGVGGSSVPTSELILDASRVARPLGYDVNSSSMPDNIINIVRVQHSNKATYCVWTSSIALNITASTKTLVHLWHPASSAKRAQMSRFEVNYFPNGVSNAGMTQIEIMRTSALHQGGVAITPEKLDQDDAAATVTVSSIPNTAPAFAGTMPIYLGSLATGSTQTAFATDGMLGRISDSKFPVLRANQAEGWAIRQNVSTALVGGPPVVLLGVCWTEE